MSAACQHFKSSLMELVYGELDEDRSEALRTHAADCPTCRRDLEEWMLLRKMAAQLPMLDPGNEIDAPVLAAAAQAAQTHRAEALSPRERLTIEPAPGFFEKLRAFMLTPALVTASVAAFVFLLSFFLYEQGSIRHGHLQEEPEEVELPKDTTVAAPGVSRAVVEEKRFPQQAQPQTESLSEPFSASDEAPEREVATAPAAPAPTWTSPQSGRGLGTGTAGPATQSRSLSTGPGFPSEKAAADGDPAKPTVSTYGRKKQMEPSAPSAQEIIKSTPRGSRRSER